MDINAATARIQKSFTLLNAAYGRAVFDELAIVSLAGESPELHYYEGPRREAFMEEFADSTLLLRQELTHEQTELGGEFSFTREGDGIGMDAYICLGPKVYLFCNNVEKSMKEITQDPAWLDAQGEFLNASQYFAVDPLQL
ncbi:hypothetical protein QEH59_01905 [Coraliomargarita sp. SDUM461004]|uniref:Uncharacterized protein n=1 Tax=Thalassobacterium sedimentorum TaxID=3041258 RepID=A0ABU1AEU5_9BACT|nr:hypothetical protein [Coraliomargarita sp. SDUM461004]MDQ8193162.1 hypothetical protein [Coraliomargarita sp. SDUM461004]